MTDTLIVGGGTAGCVLAARLSEDPSHTVVMLEAGQVWLDPAAFPEALRDATRMPLDPDAPWLWRYRSILSAGGDSAEDARVAVGGVDTRGGADLGRDAGLAREDAVSGGAPRAWGRSGRPEGAPVPGELVRGRVLGGSSSVNGSYFGRARAADFAAWDDIAGGPGWDFDAVLDGYRRSECDKDFGDRPGHGRTGPIPVVRTAHPAPISREFAAAARALGLPERDDLNALPGDGPQTGLARVPCNVDRGNRIGTATAYLLPAAHRPNLRVEGAATVSRVLVRHGRAVGVEYRRDGTIQTAWADHIVLCAGAVETAALLLRSGIGPAALPAETGIPLVHPAPVGQWFTDHPEIGLEYRVGSEPGEDPPATVPLEYVVDLDDIELRPYTVEFTPGTRRLGVALMRPRGWGVLGLSAGDPAARPVIAHRYLSEAADRARLLEAASLAEELLSRIPGARLLTRVPPATHPRSPAWLRERLATSQHLAGTCRMGAAHDERAVVDHRLRVHGVPGLSVVDLSVPPVPLSRGPHASAVMIAERAADLPR
ncbi:mycofactocin system GMC family oxidoreductase MftG [Nocardia higoensis]|uniref:mycofactocin dehydrogenase MftG n=1 Tax=Nocardia higoensis TaxID=228599 RepID=UPI001E60D035|nr:mycofactocin system GMC family oxidoreductase MftG [Nocardia higoensis]